MTTHMYYPQLKWRSAEIEALTLTPVHIQNNFSPIISLPDIDWDFVNSQYKKNLSVHLTNFQNKINSSWFSLNDIFIDTGELEKHGSALVHALDLCLNFTPKMNAKLIPVYSPNYTSNYLSALLRNKKNGVALKLNSQNISSLTSTMAAIGLNYSEVDIIFDLGDIQNSTPSIVDYCEKTINHLCGLGAWRRIILSSTSYPSSQAGIPSNVVHKIPRYEWLLWSSIIQNKKTSRTPGFSDYPTSSAVTELVDPRVMSPYVSIRYSDESNWIFVKGSAVKGNGWKQTQGLCQILIKDPCYKGHNYSWGDDHINKRANNTVSSGGSKDWRKVAQNHHFPLVVDQLNVFSLQYPATP